MKIWRYGLLVVVLLGLLVWFVAPAAADTDCGDRGCDSGIGGGGCAPMRDRLSLPVDASVARIIDFCLALAVAITHPVRPEDQKGEQ